MCMYIYTRKYGLLFMRMYIDVCLFPLGQQSAQRVHSRGLERMHLHSLVLYEIAHIHIHTYTRMRAHAFRNIHICLKASAQ